MLLNFFMKENAYVFPYDIVHTTILILHYFLLEKTFKKIGTKSDKIEHLIVTRKTFLFSLPNVYVKSINISEEDYNVNIFSSCRTRNDFSKYLYKKKGPNPVLFWFVLYIFTRSSRFLQTWTTSFVLN